MPTCGRWSPLFEQVKNVVFISFLAQLCCPLSIVRFHWASFDEIESMRHKFVNGRKDNFGYSRAHKITSSWPEHYWPWNVFTHFIFFSFFSLIFFLLILLNEIWLHKIVVVVQLKKSLLEFWHRLNAK